MAKAKGEYTPEQQAVIKIEDVAAYTREQQALIKKMAEEDAAKVKGAYTPEQQKQQVLIKKKLITDEIAAFEAAVEDRKTIDRVAAVRDGLIPPPWAVTKNQKLKLKSKRKSKSKPKRESDWQQMHIKQALPVLLDPNNVGVSWPTYLTNKEVVRKLAPEFERCGWKPASPDSVRRVRRALTAILAAAG